MKRHSFFDDQGRVARPPARHFWTEAKALVSPRPNLADYPALAEAPRGDGHPVFVLPGFMTTDGRTAKLRRFLAGLGYATYGWELGVNLGPTETALRGIERRFIEIRARHGRKISLIGHSLGGVLARDLAKKHPADVRQLIVMASPVRLPTASSLEIAYHLLARFYSDEIHRSHEDLNRAPEVPVSALYTRTDGIVAWESTRETDGPRRENIEVVGDHSTMPCNPQALLILADRLAQREGEWRPYRATAALPPRPAALPRSGKAKRRVKGA